MSLPYPYPRNRTLISRSMLSARVVNRSEYRMAIEVKGFSGVGHRSRLRPSS
jgi:hypothetical protein